MGLKNWAHLNICHGNNGKVAIDLQCCDWKEKTTYLMVKNNENGLLNSHEYTRKKDNYFLISFKRPLFFSSCVPFCSWSDVILKPTAMFLIETNAASWHRPSHRSSISVHASIQSTHNILTILTSMNASVYTSILHLSQPFLINRFGFSQIFNFILSSFFLLGISLHFTLFFGLEGNILVSMTICF